MAMEATVTTARQASRCAPPMMNDVAPVIDEEEALRADFIGSDDITAAPGRAQQGQTEGGTEQSEKYAVVAFDAIQACFELREGG